MEEIAPKNDEEWANVQNNALTLAESGNLLMIGDRARDMRGWMKMSQALVDAGVVALKAAEAKNPEALFEAGGQVYAACQQCHGQCWKEGRTSKSTAGGFLIWRTHRSSTQRGSETLVR